MNGWPALVPADWRVVFPTVRKSRRTILASTAIGGADALSTDEESFARWVLAHEKIRFDWFRPAILKRRIQSCLRLTRTSSPIDARRYLRSNPHFIPAATSALLIGVTSFFRDEQVFEVLRRQIIPTFAASGRRLRVRSVGCSSGEELYSVAILLEQAGILHRCSLMGVDCRSDAVRSAQEGVYSANQLSNLSFADRSRYLEPLDEEGNLCRVQGWLRAATTWEAHDVSSPGLISDADDGGGHDLILCRNVGIYFTADANAALWQRLTRALRPGGVLVVGSSERPSVQGLHPVGPCIYRKQPFRLTA